MDGSIAPTLVTAGASAVVAVDPSLLPLLADERLRINDLTLEAHDPFSKQPDYKKCAVRLSRARRAREPLPGGSRP